MTAHATHPLVALWDASGRPEPNWQGKAKTPKPAPEPRDGVCALTGQPGPVWPLNKVTTTLTTIDRFRHRDLDPGGLALGAAAAWAVRHRTAMQQPHITGPDGGLVEATPEELRLALGRVAVDPTVWVLVPQSRQKHLLPWAGPGWVRTDDRSLTWSARDMDRLGTLAALRQCGFGEAALAEPVPRWPILNRLDSATRQWVLLHWSDLDPWRADPDYLDVACRATRQPKKEMPDG